MSLIVSVFSMLPMIAVGYFNDEDNSTDRASFEVGVIDSVISVDTPTRNLGNDSVARFALNTSDASTLATQSRLTFTPQSCATEFYNNLLLEVATASGTIIGTFASTTVLETGVPAAYVIDVAAGSNVVAQANESCVIQATLDTWQANLAAPDTGFSSVSQVNIILTATEALGPQETNSIVLNELYPAVLATSTQPLEREWVELYNGTQAPVDVGGWRIDEFIGGDASASSRPHTIVDSCVGVTASDHMQPFNTGSTIVPAGGFLVIEFCGSASYLADAGDTVQLYNSVNQQVDSHTYPATANGKSHARIPDGAAWVDPIPTPGNKNTATRADLEAEGWEASSIDEALATLSVNTNDESVSGGDFVPATQVDQSTATNSSNDTTESTISAAGSKQALVRTASSSNEVVASSTPTNDQRLVSGTASATITTESSSSSKSTETDPVKDMPKATTTTTALKESVPAEPDYSNDPPTDDNEESSVEVKEKPPAEAVSGEIISDQAAEVSNVDSDSSIDNEGDN